jgi:hypothetical protein
VSIVADAAHELVRGFTRVIIAAALKSPAEAGREPGEVVGCEAKDFRGRPSLR